jgi:hypothetical protein
MIRACRRFVRRHGRSRRSTSFDAADSPDVCSALRAVRSGSWGERALRDFTAERAEGAENGGSERDIAAVGRIFQRVNGFWSGACRGSGGAGADSATTRGVNGYGAGWRVMGGQTCPASVKQKSGARHDRKGCFSPGTFGGRSRRSRECPPSPRSSPHPPSYTKAHTPYYTYEPRASATDATSLERRAMRPVR